jgi:hypothetical protein
MRSSRLIPSVAFNHKEKKKKPEEYGSPLQGKQQEMGVAPRCAEKSIS